MKLSEKISYTGLVLAIIYLITATLLLILSSDCRGEGCVVQLLVTFPWFFLFLSSSSTALYYITSLTLNAILWYLIGYFLGKLGKRTAAFFTAGKRH